MAFSVAEAGAISGLVMAAGVVGGALDRLTAGPRKHRDEEHRRRTEEQRNVRQLVWAVTGKPQDEWGPRQPGLIEQMTLLTVESGHLADKIGDLASRVANLEQAQLRRDEHTTMIAAVDHAAALGATTPLTPLRADEHGQ